jgi:hypothetical protein
MPTYIKYTTDYPICNFGKVTIYYQTNDVCIRRTPKLVQEDLKAPREQISKQASSPDFESTRLFWGLWTQELLLLEAVTPI